MDFPAHMFTTRCIDDKAIILASFEQIKINSVKVGQARLSSTATWLIISYSA